jgi:hypothetical protein
MSAPEFFTEAWAAAVRAAVEAGPDDTAKSTKLPEYWAFYDLVRAGYTASWALGCRDLPGGSAPSYLYLQWGGGHVTEERIIGPDDPLEATYVLAGDYADWAALLSGYDAQRTVMYRKLLLEEGDLLEFFKAIYFFVESLACLATVPTALPETAASPAPA